MISRCYSEKEHKRKPNYIGCEVCPEWRYFSTFRLWMETQDWEEKQLDKDFLGNGKLYSPETCCFVPRWLNSLFTDSGRARGRYPIGVYRNHNVFRACISIHGKNKPLGRFRTPDEAHYVYLKAKKKHVHALMKDYPDQRVKEAVLDKMLYLMGERIEA